MLRVDPSTFCGKVFDSDPSDTHLAENAPRGGFIPLRRWELMEEPPMGHQKTALRRVTAAPVIYRTNKSEHEGKFNL